MAIQHLIGGTKEIPREPRSAVAVMAAFARSLAIDAHFVEQSPGVGQAKMHRCRYVAARNSPIHGAKLFGGLQIINRDCQQQTFQKRQREIRLIEACAHLLKRLPRTMRGNQYLQRQRFCVGGRKLCFDMVQYIFGRANTIEMQQRLGPGEVNRLSLGPMSGAAREVTHRQSVMPCE